MKVWSGRQEIVKPLHDEVSFLVQVPPLNCSWDVGKGGGKDRFNWGSDNRPRVDEGGSALSRRPSGPSVPRPSTSRRPHMSPGSDGAPTFLGRLCRTRRRCAPAIRGGWTPDFYGLRAWESGDNGKPRPPGRRRTSGSLTSERFTPWTVFQTNLRPCCLTPMHGINGNCERTYRHSLLPFPPPYYEGRRTLSLSAVNYLVCAINALSPALSRRAQVTQ